MRNIRKSYLLKLIFFAVLLVLTGNIIKGINHTEGSGLKEAIVKHVIDGDTILVETDGIREKVRLIGINTPEIHHPEKGVEAYGYEAKRFTSGLVKEGEKIKLEFDVQKRDRYGRILAYVYLSDGRFLNALLVQEGYAQVMTVPPNVKYYDLFIKLQHEAHEKGRGLWKSKCSENSCPTLDKAEVKKKPVVVEISKPSVCNFVGSKVGDVFHNPYCEWAKKIKSWNRECYVTREDAMKSGRRPCRVCRP